MADEDVRVDGRFVPVPQRVHVQLRSLAIGEGEPTRRGALGAAEDGRR